MENMLLNGSCSSVAASVGSSGSWLFVFNSQQLSFLSDQRLSPALPTSLFSQWVGCLKALLSVSNFLQWLTPVLLFGQMFSLLLWRHSFYKLYSPIQIFELFSKSVSLTRFFLDFSSLTFILLHNFCCVFSNNNKKGVVILFLLQ